MKFRLIVLVVLLSLTLAACSLAEDITPPPGYTAPTSGPTNIPATLTPAPPATEPNVPANHPVVGSTETVPASSGSTTPPAGASPTAQPGVATINGAVSGLNGAVLPSGASAILLFYDTATSQVTDSLTTPILADGNYRFTNVPTDTATVYIVTVFYKGVTYESSPSQFDGTATQLDMPVTVYDSTDDLSALTITQAHMQFDFSTDGQVQVGLVYVIGNPGTSSVIFPSTGNDIPFIQVPASALNVQYQLDQSSSPLVLAGNGYAFMPGADKQYVVISTFELPYSGSLVYTQPFSPPVTSATVIVPEGIKVKSDQLTDGGTQASTGTTPGNFHLYQTGSLAAGSSLTMTISGKPGEKTGINLDQRTIIMIGIGALGLVLVALGIFLFLRDRRLRMQEELPEAAEEGITKSDDDSLGEDRESIMDAIIALDDQFRAGDISKEAYDNRRDELKDRLKNLA